MAHDVFVSHATKDKTVADAVCAMLEQEGIRCWIAPRDIQVGADWGASLIEGIRNSRVLVLVLSRAANGSPHILREVERAIHLGIPVLPVRIEDVVPAGALEYHLGTVHWLDAMTEPLEAHLKRLAETVSSILERKSDSGERREVEQSHTTPQKLRTKKLRGTAIAAGAILAFALGWFVLRDSLAGPSEKYAQVFQEAEGLYRSGRPSDALARYKAYVAFGVEGSERRVADSRIADIEETFRREQVAWEVANDARNSGNWPRAAVKYQEVVSLNGRLKSDAEAALRSGPRPRQEPEQPPSGRPSPAGRGGTASAPKASAASPATSSSVPVASNTAPVAGPDRALLNSVSGDYNFGSGIGNVALRQDGRLAFEFPGQPAYQLDHERDLRFKSSGGGSVEFRRDASGTVAEMILEQHNGRPVGIRQSGQSVDRVILPSLMGEYSRGAITITVGLRKDGVLTFSASGSPPAELLFARDLRFSIKNSAGASVEFIRGTNGEITGLTLVQMDGRFPFERRR